MAACARIAAGACRAGAKNADAKVRNQRIEGEVQDLQGGTAAVEERARYEMGMVKDGEVFVQFISPNTPASALAPVPASGTDAG